MSTRARFLLVNNPHAGRRRQGLVTGVIGELHARGCTIEEVGDDAADVLNNTARLANYDAVIGAGGDGTIRRLLRTEAGRVVPLGLIPNGTGNVLAHEIGLKPRATVIADVLIAGPEHGVQMGLSDDQPFLLMVGIGFDGDVIHRLKASLKGWIGKAAYVPTVVRAVLAKPSIFSVEIDGASHVATWAVVANARHYGGNFTIAPQAGLTKRSFEVVLFGSQSRTVRIRQLLALASGAVDQAPHVRFASGHRISVNTTGQHILAQADGDPLPRIPSQICCSEPVRLIVPRRFMR